MLHCHVRESRMGPWFIAFPSGLKCLKSFGAPQANAGSSGGFRGVQGFGGLSRRKAATWTYPAELGVFLVWVVSFSLAEMLHCDRFTNDFFSRRYSVHILKAMAAKRSMARNFLSVWFCQRQYHPRFLSS